MSKCAQDNSFCKIVYEFIVVVAAHDSVYEWYLNAFKAKMEESCCKVRAFGAEYAHLLSLCYYMAEKRNLLCVETLAYMLYNKGVVTV